MELFMKSKGLRIFDTVGDYLSVTLPDILNEIHDGELLHWSILFLNGCGDLGEGKSIPLFQNQIYHSEKGYLLSWEELNILSHKFYQIYDIDIIGCYNKKLLARYENDQVMCEKCDIVIMIVDSTFCQVFSKDETLINRLAAKFKNTKFLEPDFER
jgi:hypothetical protein